ncbi:MAG TPA: tyrosine-type recombinase/integrase, partial [Phycisphaerales bacterium]|nr:tyrosine-type recombinase/integrase [Phycisphaerales bacterium]
MTYEQTRRSLEEFIGEKTDRSRVTALEAERWRTWLKDNQQLAGATIAKRVKTARQVFKRAVKWKMLAENPFEDIRTGSQSNPARMHFVDTATVERVLAACPDVEWRLIFALSRYGGLRCPSEVLTLRWGDIQWDADRFTVWSCKTEGYEGCEYRHVPLFPELRPLLEEAFARADEGSEYVITRYRGSDTNLRTTLLKILARAGVSSWPKLFQNLRSSRATELCAEHPAHVVAAWMGHTVTVAQRHYLQVRDCDFERACREPGTAGTANSAA